MTSWFNEKLNPVTIVNRTDLQLLMIHVSICVYIMLVQSISFNISLVMGSNFLKEAVRLLLNERKK